MLFKVTYTTLYPGSKKEKLYIRAHGFECAKEAITALLEEARGDDWELLSVENINNFVDWIEIEEESMTDEEGDIHSEFEKAVCQNCGTTNDIPKGMKATNCVNCKGRIVVEDNNKDDNENDENKGDIIPDSGE